MFSAKFFIQSRFGKISDHLQQSLMPLLQQYERDLPALFITSQVVLEGHDDAETTVAVHKADGVKCERCWKFTLDVGSDAKLPTCCAPCAAAVTEILSP